MKQGISRMILLALLSVLAISSGSFAHDPPQPPGVIHVVLVWLKEAGNSEHREQVIEGSKALKAIPGVLDLRVGAVIPSDREVVDSSYDVALYLRFKNQQDLQDYLVHPLHKSTVREVIGPVMDRYRVYDFRDE